MAPATTMVTNTEDFKPSVGFPVSEQLFHVSENTVVSRNRDEIDNKQTPIFKRSGMAPSIIMFSFIAHI